MTDRVKKLVEYLQGTCNSFNSACETLGFDGDDLSREELEEFDNEIFCCDECSWWYEIGESRTSASGDNVCENCSEDEEE